MAVWPLIGCGRDDSFSVRLTRALVRRCFWISPAKYAQFRFNISQFALQSHDSLLIFRGLGPLLGSTTSSSHLSPDKT